MGAKYTREFQQIGWDLGANKGYNLRSQVRSSVSDDLPLLDERED